MYKTNNINLKHAFQDSISASATSLIGQIMAH